jgi:hypothetical protein
MRLTLKPEESIEIEFAPTDSPFTGVMTIFVDKAGFLAYQTRYDQKATK